MLASFRSFMNMLVVDHMFLFSGGCLWRIHRTDHISDPVLFLIIELTRAR